LTRQHETPTGGLHELWLLPLDATIITSSTSQIAAGIDVIGLGGMIIGPPTYRPGRGAYRERNNAPLVHAPDWLVKLAVEAAGRRDNVGDRTVDGDNTHTPTEAAIVAATMAVIPNNTYVGRDPDLENWEFDWHNWNRLGMAIWRETGGSEEGFVIFDTWSQNNRDKYNARETRKKWDGYCNSPPNQISYGSIRWLANKADPDWEARYDHEQLAKQNEAVRRARAKRRANTEEQDQQQDQQQEQEPQQQNQQEQEPQQQEEQNEASVSLLFRLAERVWGPATCVGQGEWQFGENVFPYPAITLGSGSISQPVHMVTREI